MTGRRRYLLREEQQYKKQRKAVNRITFAAIALCVVLGFVLPVATGGEKAPAQASPPPAAESSGREGASAPPPQPEPLPWQLMVVSKESLLPKDYSVKLKKIGTEQVDERIYQPLTDMIDAAAADGVSLLVCSGYRSVATQDRIFSEKVQELMDAGMGQEASVVEAQKYLQPPGASEHHTGLSLDFLTDSYTVLDSGFADTEACRWLQAHAVEYGFIERYPESDQEETGVFWEPWHYRYVGTEYAEKIKASGLTLEAYTRKLAQEN